jgi:hypothetical protein
MPGPICTWERDYEVNDGTSCRMPSQTPGPIVNRSHHVWERGEAVFEAYEKAYLLAPAAVARRTGYALGQILKSLLPGLLQALIVLAATTSIGAAAGAVIGFFFGGVGAAPGAVIGGELGFDIGTAVLSWLGLAFLAVVIVQGFGELWATISRGVKRAWAAPESPERQYPHEIDAAANDFAEAVAILVLLILQGIVAYVFAKAGIKATKGALTTGRAVGSAGADVAAADAVAALIKQLRASKLGSGFADWVEENWPRLRDDPKLRWQPRDPIRSGSVEVSPATSQPESAGISGERNIERPAPGSPEHKAIRWEQYQARGGKWDYGRWSKQYDVNMQNPIRGLGREQAYRDALGGESVTVETPLTNRQVDIFRPDDNYMGQLKTGKESLTVDNIEAIRKDATLVDKGYTVEYILEKGASKPFLDALDNAGISYKIGPQIPQE